MEKWKIFLDFTQSIYLALKYNSFKVVLTTIFVSMIRNKQSFHSLARDRVDTQVSVVSEM